MRLLASLAVLVVLAGCSGLEPREPMPAGPGFARPIQVRVQKDYASSDPSVPAPGRFAPEVDPAAVAARAQELFRERSSTPSGSAVALVTTIVQANARYLGQTGILPLKVFFTVFFFPIDFPNYFISSDRFVLTLTARWQVLDNGQILAEGTAQGKQVGLYGDLSRGWFLFGYLRMPSPLSGEHWQEIATPLVPGAQDALAEDLVLEVEKALAKPR